jgi:hypothetical protein
MWQVKNGILRIGNTYIGSNGRKYGNATDLLPLENGIVYDKVGEEITFYNDWVILKKAHRAYHKDGTIVHFTHNKNIESNLDRVNTKFPRAIIYNNRVIYDFYLDKSGESHPYYGRTKIEAERPLPALKLYKKFIDLFGFPPDQVNDLCATAHGNTVIRLYHNENVEYMDENGRMAAAAVDKIKKTFQKTKRNGITYHTYTPNTSPENENTVNLISVVFDAYDEILDELLYPDTPENRKIIEQIFEELKEDYRTMNVKLNDYGSGYSIPKYFKKYAEKITEVVEKYLPISWWELEPVKGELQIRGLFTYPMPEEIEIIEKIKDEISDVPLKPIKEVFKKKASKQKLKEVKVRRTCFFVFDK